MLTDILCEVPRLATCLSSDSFAALLACYRELRHAVHHSVRTVSITSLADLLLLKKRDWSKLTMVVVCFDTSFRHNVFDLRHGWLAKFGFAREKDKKNDKPRILYSSIRHGIDLDTRGLAGLHVADTLDIVLTAVFHPAICILLCLTHYVLSPGPFFSALEPHAEDLVRTLKHECVLQSRLGAKRITSLKPNSAQMHVHNTILTDIGKEAPVLQSVQHNAAQCSLTYGVPMPLVQLGKDFVLREAEIYFCETAQNRYIRLSTVLGSDRRHPPCSIQVNHVSTGLIMNWLETVDCSSLYLAGPAEPV